MINPRAIICYLRAIPQIFQHRFFIPHVYMDQDPELVTIVSTDTSFRVYNNDTAPTKLLPGETLHKHAALIRSKCIYCGKESWSWKAHYEFRNEDLLDQLYSNRIKEDPEG